jgi:hypothetical protein
MEDALSQSWSDLLFAVRRSIRYHSRRRMFFDRLHTITSAVGVIFGSATILAVLTEAGHPYAVLAAAVVTIFSALDLVIGTDRSARLHQDLARQFINLEKRMLSLAADPTAQDLKYCTGERLDIESDEPPVLRVLDVLCHNELCRAMGRERAHMAKVAWYQRLFAQLIDVRPDSLRLNSEKAS